MTRKNTSAAPWAVPPPWEGPPRTQVVTPPEVGAELSAATLALLDPTVAEFDPFTGADIAADTSAEQRAESYSPSQRKGLDAPRYCPCCGRRMKVQVLPTGWLAECSRHGIVDSTMLYPHT